MSKIPRVLKKIHTCIYNTTNSTQTSDHFFRKNVRGRQDAYSLDSLNFRDAATFLSKMQHKESYCQMTVKVMCYCTSRMSHIFEKRQLDTVACSLLDSLKRISTVKDVGQVEFSRENQQCAFTVPTCRLRQIEIIRSRSSIFYRNRTISFFVTKELLIKLDFTCFLRQSG